MRCRLLALDLDGTLLRPDGTVSDANLDAVRRAHDAGILVVPCTGRAWREARDVTEQLPMLDIGVFVTGAAVCRLSDGEALDLAVIEPHLAERLVAHLAPLPEAVLVFQDAGATGCDYLVTGSGQLSGNTEWWFGHTGAIAHFQSEVTADDLHHTLRVGVVTDAERMVEIEASVKEAFGDEVFCHSFAAVSGPASAPERREMIHVLEVFGTGTDKWRGLSYLAAEHEIAAQEVVAIGDEINDLAMVEQAGCGIAMANAVDPVKAAADQMTAANTEDGVARAIDKVLDGTWGG